MHTVPCSSFSSISEAFAVNEGEFGALSWLAPLLPGDLAALADVPTAGLPVGDLPHPDCVATDAGTGTDSMAVPVQNLTMKNILYLVFVELFVDWR